MAVLMSGHNIILLFQMENCRAVLHSWKRLRLKSQRYPFQPNSFVSPSVVLRRAAVSYWLKYVHKVLVNHLGGLNLPRKSVVRLTDMIIAVYLGPNTTTQHNDKWRISKKKKKIPKLSQ